jgi:molybdopterin synthase sulfur carrier subunit
MPRVFLPSMLREAAGGSTEIEASGATVRAVLDDLDRQYPGLKARLCEGDRLRSNLAVAVNGELEPLGVLAKVDGDAEIHFVPAISGGL